MSTCWYHAGARLGGRRTWGNYGPTPQCPLNSCRQVKLDLSMWSKVQGRHRTTHSDDAMRYESRTLHACLYRPAGISKLRILESSEHLSPSESLACRLLGPSLISLSQWAAATSSCIVSANDMMSSRCTAYARPALAWLKSELALCH